MSCKKEKIKYDVPCNNPTSDITVSKSLIVGKWEWVSELYRVQFTNQYIPKTPQSEGYTRLLIVYPDRIEFFKNNSFEQKYRYDFVIESTITNYYGDSLNVLVFKDFDIGQRSSHTNFNICNDTLVLNFQIISDIKGQEKWEKIN